MKTERSLRVFEFTVIKDPLLKKRIINAEIPRDFSIIYLSKQKMLTKGHLLLVVIVVIIVQASCANIRLLSGGGTDNCAKYAGNGNCQKCEAGYYLNQNYNCVVYPPDCYQVNAYGTCTQCYYGYYLNANYACVPYPANCYKVNAAGVCTQCYYYYYLDYNYVCQPYPPHCNHVNAQGSCVNCQSGYKVMNAQCVSKHS